MMRPPGANYPAPPGREDINRVLAVIRQPSDRLLSLSEMSRIAQLSPSHFDRVFLQVTGVRPRTFQAAQRMHAATRLLLTTKLSVTEICYEVGYTSFGTFVTRFREAVGLSPGQLRAAARRLHGSSDSVRTPAVGTRVGELEVRVVAPAGFAGTIFIGAFPGCLPFGPPLACATLNRSGHCRLDVGPRPGMGVFAVAFEQDTPLLEAFLRGDLLRGALTGLSRERRSRLELRLRPPSVTDPPILPALPFLASLAPERRS